MESVGQGSAVQVVQVIIVYSWNLFDTLLRSLVPPADLGGPIVAQPDAVDLFHNKSIFGNDNI